MFLGQFVHFNQQRDRRRPTEKHGLTRWQARKLLQQTRNIIRNKPCD